MHTPRAAPAIERQTPGVVAAPQAHRTAWRRALSIPRLTLAMLVLGLVWRLFRYLVFMPMWGDESFVAINFLRRDFRGMIEPLLWGQIVPLGFMWAELAVSRVLGVSEYALRLLPTLAALAAMVLFWRFAARTLPRRAAMLAVALFAGSYYIVRHGAEVKPYSTDLLVSLVLTILTRGVMDRGASRRAWTALVAAAAAAVWLSYPALFVAGGAALALAGWARRSRAGLVQWTGLVAYAAIVGGSSAAMVWFIARPHAAAAAALVETSLWARTFPPLELSPWLPLRLPLWFAAIHTGPMFGYPQGANAPGSIVTFVLFVIGCAALWRVNRDMLWLWLAPFGLNLAAAAIKAYPYGGAARICQHFAPAICWLAGLGAARVVHLMRSRVPPGHAAAACAGVLCIIPIGAMIGQAIKPYQSLGSKRSYEAVVALAARTAPGDRWIVFNADHPVDYAPYWGDWRGIGGQFVYDVARLSPVPVEWGPRPQDIAPPARGSVWLMNYRIDGQKVEFPRAQWDAYFSTVVERLGQPQFESHLIMEKSRRRLAAAPRDARTADAEIDDGPAGIKTEVLEIYRFQPVAPPPPASDK